MTLNQRLKKILLFLVQISIAAGIILWMVSGKMDQLGQALKNISFGWFSIAIVLYVLHLVFGAWRWKLLLEVQKIKISLFEAFSITMQALFFSLVIPGGTLGGDVVKAGFIAKRTPEGKKLKGVFSILIDRVVGMIGMFFFAGIIGLLSIGFLRSLSGAMEFVVYILILGCVLGFGSVILLFFHRRLEKISLIKSLVDIVDRYSKGSLSNLMNAMDEYRSSWRTLVICFLMSVFLIHLNLGIVVCLIEKSAGIDSSPKVCLIATALGNAVGVIPLTPSGIGTRDTLIKKILMAGDLDETKATLIPLIFTCIILLFNLSGGLFFAFNRILHRSSS